jgi:hypothetical protein
MKATPCPNCDSAEQYQSKKPISAGGGNAPNYLTDTGSAWLNPRNPCNRALNPAYSVLVTRNP